MQTTTLEELKTLKDAEFHALGDEILPFISSNYRNLVPYGRNEKGNSIQGQPDSYVGDTAKTCRIAIQYTTQKKSWWTKVVDDVQDARVACPNAEEIVVVLPQDIDRQEPKKGKGLAWYQDAKKAAASADLTLIHGRKLAHQLNTACQDLRLKYLGIPVSRLSFNTLLAGCREASEHTLQRLKSLKRYDAKRYINREADDRFFSLWQEAIGIASGHSYSSNYNSIIPLIADSGIGKTSLLAHFTEGASKHRPVLLLLARDLSFDKSDSLITYVMNRLQGIMDPSSRSTEESHLAMKLAGKTPITVILDGLDEATNAKGLRKAIDTWLWSRLGKSTVLVLSSRPEFWRKCRDSTWSNYILNDNKYPKDENPLRHEREISELDPMQGIEIPGNFSQQELLKAWKKSKQSEDKFWQLPIDLRRELLHPFTLKSVLDLLATDVSLTQLRTRSTIMNLWLKSRLELEIDSEIRVTETQFRKCLSIVAQLASEKNGSWVSIENLDEVPRFNKIDPPGPVIEKLISANILETHPERLDQIRFSFEAVQDFFLAESMINDIKNNTEKAAKKIGRLSFSEAVTSLERIGDKIVAQPYREKFVRSLAEIDAPKAAVIIRSDINAYSPDCREFVVSNLSELLRSPMEAKQAIATELLGRLVCQESKSKIENHWTSTPPSNRIHRLVSSTAISHSSVELIPCIFKTWWFKRDRFYVNLRPELMASTQYFRNSLTEYALNFIPSEEHTDNYQRALMLLSYLGDDHAVNAIKKRTKDSIPYFYESLCLLAIGTPQAVKTYSMLIDRYLKAKEAGLEKEKNESWRSAVVPHAQVGNLVTHEVEEFVISQIKSKNKERQAIGLFLARWLGTERLLYHRVKDGNVEGNIEPFVYEFGKRLGAEKWIELWKESSTKNDKKGLIQIARDIQNAQVEEILISCLQDDELAGSCTQSLAMMGSQRACPAIRSLLSKEPKVSSEKNWTKHLAFLALATLRDPGSIPEMVTYLESEEHANEFGGATTTGLACIGTEEAETALLELNNISDKELVRGLVHFGSRTCIERAIEISKQCKNKKAGAWLAEQCRHSMWGGGFHGRPVRLYRTDIDIKPLLDFVLAEEPSSKVYEHISWILNDIDSSHVRLLLRKWYDLQDTPNDINLEIPNGSKLSDFAYNELVNRGDDHVLTAHFEREVQHFKDYRIHNFFIEKLALFDRYEVQKTLRTLLQDNPDEKSLRVILDLIGYVGNQSDLSELNNLIKSENDLIANAAFEAKLRLTDPLRLAEHW